MSTKLLKNPVQVFKRFYTRHFQKRISFSATEVAGNQLPTICANLYLEVAQLNEAIGDYYAEKSLEVGAGYGRLTPWISEHSQEHYAIEPEKKLFEIAERLNPNAKFFNVAAQKLPFPDSTFDLAVTWTVLQHVPPQNLNLAVSEIKRVCKPYAIIVLAEATGGYHDACYWERPVEEWQKLMQPWSLVWCENRKADLGLVMRFAKKV